MFGLILVPSKSLNKINEMDLVTSASVQKRRVHGFMSSQFRAEP